MTPDEIRQQIELAAVEMIKRRTAAGTMDDLRAQAISQHVLATLRPGMSFEELYQAIPKLDDTFPELSEVVLPILQNYERTINQQALDSMRELIKQGQYDAAANLGKKTASQQIKLQFYGQSKK